MGVVSIKKFLKDKGFIERTVRNSYAVSKQSDIVIKRRWSLKDKSVLFVTSYLVNM